MNRAKLPDRPSPQSPSDAQAREKLAIFVYEYLTHMGAKNAAKNFLDEIGWNKDVKISDGPGFLQTWWCVFWDLYCAAPDRRATHEHSQEAKAFHDFGMLPGLMNGLHVPNPVGSPMGGSDAGAGPSTSAAGLRQQQSPLAQPHGGVMPGMYMSRLPSAGAPNGGRLPPPGHIAPPGYAAMRPGSVQRPPWMPPSTSMGPPGGGVPTSMALNGADGGMAPVSANGPLADASQPHQAHNGHAYPMPMYGVGVMPVDGGPAPSNPDNAESIGSGTAPPNNKRRRQSSGVADRPGSADTKSLSGGGAMGGPLAAGDMKGSPAPPACVGKNHSGGPGSVPAPASLTPGAGMSANPPSVSKTSSGRQMSGGNNKQNSDSIDFNSAAPYPQGENEQSEIAKIKASIMDDSKQFEGKDPNGESEFF